MNAYSAPLAGAFAAAPMGANSPSQEQQQQPPPPTDLLPSISPSAVYSTVHAVWSPQELQVFHQGLAAFPADQFDNVTRYVKVAALLPGKCARDVAFRAKALSAAHESMSMSRDQFAKRMKLAPYQPPDAAAKFAFSTPPAFDDPQDVQLSALLQDNAALMAAMRANLLSGKLDANADPMAKFRDNCGAVLSTLGDICNAVPPLPIQLDMSLLPPSAADAPRTA